MPYRYKVIQRCFREARLMLPGQEFVTDLPQPSAALEPADEATKVATAAKQAEYDKAKIQEAAISGAESVELRMQNATLQDQLAALQATVEKLAAAKSDDGKRRQ